MELSFDIFEKIADLADIDTRRAMGFLPRQISTERLNSVKLLFDRHVAMQRHYYQFIEGISVYSRCTLLPVSPTRCLYYSYYIIFDKVQICIITIDQVTLSMLEHNGFTWRGIGSRNAIYIDHPFTPCQAVDMASCYGISSILSPANIAILQKVIKTAE